MPAVEQEALTGVSCTSNSFCVGAGWQNSTSNPLAEHWNGSEWTTKSTPAGGELWDVSCTASSACTAVGWKIAEGKSVTLALRWNGLTWAAQTTPNPGNQANYLHGVSCTSATSCIAVGRKVTTTGEETLAMSWNGSTWTTQSSPTPAGTEVGIETHDISCTSGSACTAVGEYLTELGELPFAMRWNGSSWSLQQVKLPAKTNFGRLEDVSCTSSTFCMAVGRYEASSNLYTMAQRWDGTSWTAEKPPSPGSFNQMLQGVSCLASNWCKGVGSYFDSEGVRQTLVEHFSG